MDTNSKAIRCIPEKDNFKRFALGRKGNSELLAIGLNPSSANEITLDPTSRNIERIALKSNCDGWWLVNLYPMRTSKPYKLAEEDDSLLGEENLAFIRKMILNKAYNINKVLCCWGNNISIRGYLQSYCEMIMNELSKLEFETFSLGQTIKGNPYHPSPTSINRYLGGIHNVSLKEYKYTKLH